MPKRKMPTGNATDYSGQTRLRMGPEMHADVARAAAAEGVSINTWLVTRIARELGRLEQQSTDDDRV